MEPDDEDVNNNPSSDSDEPDNADASAPVSDADPVAAPEVPVPSAPDAPSEPAPVDSDTDSAPADPVLSQTPPITPVDPTIPTQPSFRDEQRRFLRGIQPEGIAGEKRHHDEKLERVMAFARTKKSFSNEELRLALALPRRTADDYLSQLVAAGRLIRTGPKSRTRYEVPE